MEHLDSVNGKSRATNAASTRPASRARPAEWPATPLSARPASRHTYAQPFCFNFSEAISVLFFRSIGCRFPAGTAPYDRLDGNRHRPAVPVYSRDVTQKQIRQRRNRRPSGRKGQWRYRCPNSKISGDWTVRECPGRRSRGGRTWIAPRSRNTPI